MMTLVHQSEQPDALSLLALPAPPEEVEEVPLAAITVDCSLNVRQGPNQGIDDTTVEAYMHAFDSLAPVALYRLVGPAGPDGTLLLADGFHRYQAATNLRRGTIRAWVFIGDRAAAEAYAALANLNHGKPLTTSEKKVALGRLLRQHPHLADNLLAARAGMSPHTVRRVREDLEQRGEIPVLLELLGGDNKLRPREYRHILPQTPAPVSGPLGTALPPAGAAASVAAPTWPAAEAPGWPLGRVAPPAACPPPSGGPPEQPAGLVLETSFPDAPLRDDTPPALARPAVPLVRPSPLVLPPGPYWSGTGPTAGFIIYQGDVDDLHPAFGSGGVGLIIADPPYNQVVDEPWDHQWDTPAGYLDWLAGCLRQWYRLLRPNGSLYLFASPDMASQVENLVRQYFHVLNCVRWEKEAGWHKKQDIAALWSYLSPWEAVIFAEHYSVETAPAGQDIGNGFVFEPIREYLDGERRRAGIDYEQVRQAVGCAAGSGLPGHWFTTSQWFLPVAEHYAVLQRLFAEQGRQPPPPYADYHPAGAYWEQFHQAGAAYLQCAWPYLRLAYEDLSRPFSLHEDSPRTDLWAFPTVQFYPGKHPCEKPVPLLEHIVRTSSRAGDVILDCFAGSGAAGEAVARLGQQRRYIAIEKKPEYCQHIVDRLTPLLGLSAGGQ